MIYQVTLSLKKKLDAMFRIKMVKFELAIIDRTRFIFIKQIYASFIRPIFAGLSILWKYIVVIPFIHIITKLFPKAINKLQPK